ncbi:MAG: type VI secretion system protein TssL, long form [Pseudomonadota bacterium]
MSIVNAPLEETEATAAKPAGGMVARQALPAKANMARSDSIVARLRAWSTTDATALNSPARLGLAPLVKAALPLLNLAGRLRVLSEQPDLEALRTRIIQAFKSFESEALGAGVPPERVRAAHYAFCATLDDIVLSAPWGAYSLWSRQGMVTTFHGDVTGGERFFDLLAHLHKDPGTNGDVLLLMYHCLSIGFEGRMRVHPQGHLELGRIRDGLYRTLRTDTERELSPQWRGVDMRHRPLSTPLILWTGALLAALILVAAYFGLATALDQRSDVTLTALLEAPPAGLPTIARSSPPKPKTAAKPVRNSADWLATALGNEIKDGIATVKKGDGGSLIRLRNEGFFEVGRADISNRFAEVVDRIGRVLRGTAAEVTVVGYTDNKPIHTMRFPSNYYLSVARAEAVARLLGQHVDPARIRSEGRGAAEPVADNATPQGRAQNRRTEIMVIDRQEQ